MMRLAILSCTHVGSLSKIAASGVSVEFDGECP